MTGNTGVTVLLSNAESAASLVADLAMRGHPTVWYTSLEELVRKQPLSSIAVLVFHFSPLPKGVMLPVIARLAIEYPSMQKAVVMEERPSIPLAEYLTACGADLIWAKPKATDLDRLASVVERMRERTRWVAHQGGELS
jgi:hypothetical protein